MVQSLNKTAELTTQGISYLGMGAKYGHFLIGDQAFEFFNENNVADYIQIPWTNVKAVYAQVSKNHIGRCFRVTTDSGNFDFSAKESGKVLKVMREHLGDQKVLRQPTLWRSVLARFKKRKDV